MRLGRVLMWSVVCALAAAALRAFPEDPAQRAAVVCEPLQWMLAAAASIASAMDDSGRIGSLHPPWREDPHRSCVRVAERIFQAAAQAR
jgi:hypothetical protein